MAGRAARRRDDSEDDGQHRNGPFRRGLQGRADPSRACWSGAQAARRQQQPTRQSLSVPGAWAERDLRRGSLSACTTQGTRSLPGGRRTRHTAMRSS
eukprot:12611417-Heterocapsa_arctica.AAC.1